MRLIHLSIPDSATDEEVLLAIREQRQEQAAEDAHKARILASDAALKELQDSFGVPLTRAETYQDRIANDQEIRGYWGLGPRRPVVMRGAKIIGISRRALSKSLCANGYAIDLAYRYLRMTKFTSFDAKEIADAFDSIPRRAKLDTTRAFEDRIPLGRGGGNIAFVAGKRVHVTDHQLTYLKRLCRLAKKLEVAEDRKRKMEHKEEERAA